MSTHYEASLEQDLARIRGKVLEMANLAEGALKRTVRALVERDRQLAYSVILRDQRIDELEKEIDRLCLEFLVRQQPVAGTLRFVYSTIKINTELERIGDYAESIARQVLKLTAQPCELPQQSFEQIANLAIPMLRDAVRAFLAQDGALASATMKTEVEADELRNRISAELLDWHVQGRIPLAMLTPLTTIARRFERVTDQAKNICEETLYICTGVYQKHKDTEVFRVLFVDDDNACLSQLAEAVGAHMGEAHFLFSSAGVQPGELDATTRSFLADKGYEVSRLGTKTVAQVPNLEHYQILVALSPAALKAVTPPPAKQVVFSWEVVNPAKVVGTAVEVRAAFEEAHRDLKSHVEDLAKAILGDETEYVQ